MLVAPKKNRLDSSFKKVRVFKVAACLILSDCHPARGTPRSSSCGGHPVNRKRAEYGFGEYGFKHRTQ